MMAYLAEMWIGEQSNFKIGLTKYYYPIKRFLKKEYREFREDKKFDTDTIEKDDLVYVDPLYHMYDKIKILAKIKIQHKDPLIARQQAALVEAHALSLFPKNFRLEEYYDTEENYFDSVSGRTEMFILNPNQTRSDVIRGFNNIKRSTYRILGNPEERNQW